MNRSALAGVVILLALAADAAASTARSTRAVRDLVRRVLPAQAKAIRVRVEAAAHGPDFFALETRAGRLHIRGSSGVAVASGLRHYLEHYANAHVSWGGTRLRLTGSLPPVPDRVRRSTDHEVRYAWNFTVFGYSTPFWDWDRWEQEIDLLAMSGFNLALVAVGYEQVLIDTFTRFGYPADELRDWIVLPAHQPWQWLGNLQSLGPPMSAALIARRVALGRRIVARMRALGITPVLPGYYGLVPPGFAARTGATVVEQGSWLGVAERPDLLDPTDDEHFRPVARTHYQALEAIFGRVTHFAADPVHEGGSLAGVDVGAAAANIQRAMRRATRPSVWMLQGWFGNPRDELLAGLDPRRALVVDLWGDELPQYLRFTGAGEVPFRGVPWVWSIIQSFGGATAMTGNLAVIADQVGQGGVFQDPARGRLRGLGLTMEAIEQNPVVYDLLAELIWNDPVDLDAWLAAYADRRYGTPLAATRAAWTKLVETAYSTTPRVGAAQSILCARPSLTVEFAGLSSQGTGDPHYDTARFEQAAADLLSAAAELGGVDTYRYDVVDVTRQVLANRARPLLDAIRAAFEARDAARVDCLSRRFLDLIMDQDRLVATRPEFLLGVWLWRARSWGESRTEEDALERDARMILTTWTEDDSLLRDYAYREWAGLLRDLYHRRWQRFFEHLAAELAGGAGAPPDIFALESSWVNATDPDATAFPIEPVGDPIAIAAEVFAKHTGPEPSCEGASGPKSSEPASRGACG